MTIEVPVPVLTAVNGPAAGYAPSLACAADLVFAAESAYFLLPFITIGLMPDCGATRIGRRADQPGAGRRDGPDRGSTALHRTVSPESYPTLSSQSRRIP